MENRGQKRADTVDELPADKRACSSFDFRTNTSSPTYLMSSYSIPETHSSSIETQMSPARHSTPETHNSSDETQVNSTQAILDGPQNSSIQLQVNSVPDEALNSFVQTQVNSHNSTPDNSRNGDVDTYSSASGSSRSDGENERDSAYGSCDSDDDDENLREYQERESSSAPGRFKSIISSLSEESDPSGQLAGLSQLCEVLSFCTESSVSNTTADSLSPLLVSFSRHESNPDVMLLAIRAVTYLCDVFPQSSIFLVQHDAVPALCQRLMAIEYMDVAEQCLQAMEKISRDQPLACLQAGAVMAVLNYIDFFSTSLQRVALSTVVNICKKLPSECPSIIEAVPILCNLLQYEDRQLVENVANCLIKIVERVSPSSDMLDEICKHGLVNQATHLINLNSRTTISQPIYNSLIGLLVKLASGSVIAFSTLYELNISSILKDILSTHELSHGMSPPYVADGRCSQVYEVLKLLNELLPGSARDLNVQPMMDKGSFLFNHPDLLQGFGMDILPTLIQVINSGANLYVCYGCLSVINKLVNLTQPDMLLELLKDANVSSFLAGVFTRKDHHVLMLALEIAEVILQKLSNYYLTSFIKEGVLFAIDALLTPEKCSRLMFPMFGELSVDPSSKSAGKEVRRCLCYAFNICQSSKASEGSCKIEKDSVHNLANQIRTSYFRAELCESEKGTTDILQKLKGYSVELDNLMNTYTDDSADQHDGKCSSILHQIVAKLSGREQISTFEFIESGLVKSLVSYLSCGQYARRDKAEFHSVCGISYTIEERFEVLGRVFFSSSDTHFEDFPLLVLIQKLQSALCSLENFPVILSPMPKRKHSLATVPNRRSIVHPCLRVAFVRGEGETCLREHAGDVLTVDPLSSFDAIEDFLRPGVFSKRTELARPYTTETIRHTLSSQDEIPDPMDSDMSAALTQLEIDGANLSQTAPRRQVHSAETSSMDGNHVDSAIEEQYLPVEADTDRKFENHASCSGDYASSKLLFYLGEQELDRTLTFYQAILQQLIKAENAIVFDPKFWSQTYTVTYRSFIEPKLPEPQEGLLSTQHLSLLDKVRSYVFSSMFICQLASDLDMSDPTYDIVLLLKSLERMNRLSFHLMARERIVAFAEGRTDSLDDLKIAVASVPQKEFVSSKLTEKLEQQMKDTLAVSTGGIPPWCIQLMTSCPFLFSFEARSKYFRLEAFGTQQVQIRSSNNNNGSPSDRRSSTGGLPRRKFLVCRDRVLESAAQMMDLYARKKVVIEVEYTEEVGTGLGPTLEFYTLVSLEFQKCGLCMWRGDQNLPATSQLPQGNDPRFLTSPCGLFPRPWSSALEISNGVQFSEVTKKFVLLGQVVAKALQDGRVMDFPFSKAFYKLILGQELSLYDIQSFDPELGQTLLEFHAIVARNMHLDSVGTDHLSNDIDSCFRGTKIEDLCLDFTLPGYPDYHLTSGSGHSMVNMTNLEDYVSLIVNATIKDGISRQLEAFKSGFNQVFPIEHLHMFTEEEIERLLCGESETWAFNELIDHIKFDHGYTASSPPITNLLELILELNNEERRAFIQFVTGAPRLPPGGLASLHPKLTIVRKHCSKRADEDLPSVMTCANYLKLPPYSSKERMKEKLLYAITEGQGSFHLS